MARTQSRTKTDIWNDDEFKALTRSAQRLYWVLYSQPTISLCGVLACTPGRWSRLASDDTLEGVWLALKELESAESRFIIIDLETEEIFVRSFMRNDGVWNSPKTKSAAKDRVSAVMSQGLRQAIDVEMCRLDDEYEKSQADTLCDGVSQQTEQDRDGVSDRAPDGVGHTRRVRARAASSLQPPVSSLHPPLKSDGHISLSLTGVVDSIPEREK